MKLRLVPLSSPLAIVGVAAVVLFISQLAGLWLGRSVLLNQTGPAILGAVCIWAAYLHLRNEPHSLWTPVPWFLVACTVYFGFGPLVYHFGSEESVTYIDNFYAANERDIARTNMLNAISVALVLSGYFLGKMFLQRYKPEPARHYSSRTTRRFMFIFLAIGISVEIFLILPYRLGLLSWTLPGVIQYLSTFSKIAIILLFVLVGRGFVRYRLLLYSLIGFEFIIAIMSFAKLEVIELFIALGLGWYLARANLRGLVVGGVAVVLLYVFILSPFVTFARLAYNASGVGTVGEVAEVIEDYSGTERGDLAGFLPGVQGWWTRFSYTNAQSFAMNDYEHGDGGETFELVPYAIVPRLLYPDKPIMTPGREFTAVVTGYDSLTHTAPGIFAEAYWNGGWMLVVVTCLYVGLVFAGFAKFVEHSIGVGKYVYLPVVMVGISMGYSPVNWFAATYVGALAQAFGLYVLLRVMAMVLLRSARKTNSSADLSKPAGDSN